jgi:hypothetical protein
VRERDRLRRRLRGRPGPLRRDRRRSQPRNTGAGGCADGTALDHPILFTVTPDGKNVYGASFVSNAVTVFSRDKKKGSLTQLPGTAACVSDNGSGGACSDGVALLFVHGLAVAPNGANVYAAFLPSYAVDAFTRKKK